jgi:hypothetical protein
MEVHAPHASIHSVKDFLFHLLAITVGLLIALGLEALVSTIHHRHQVAEARQTLSAEIGTNARELQKHLERLNRQRETLDEMKSALHSTDPSAGRNQHLNVSLADLQRASYDAALASNTFSLMDYAEASRYAALYRQQAVFDNLQAHAVIDVEMSLVGMLPGAQNSLEGFQALSSPERMALSAKLNEYRAQLVLYIAAAEELAREYAKYQGEIAHP